MVLNIPSREIPITPATLGDIKWEDTPCKNVQLGAETKYQVQILNFAYDKWINKEIKKNKWL